MPKSVTIDVQLQQLTNRMHIPYFRGIFMCTILSTGKVHQNESGIVNLDNAEGLDIHWIAYARGNRAIYFDSFGKLRPPKELMRYLENNVTQIEYNRLINVMIKTIAVSCVYSFCKQLTINLKIDTVLLKLSIKHVADIYIDRQK